MGETFDLIKTSLGTYNACYYNYDCNKDRDLKKYGNYTNEFCCIGTNKYYYNTFCACSCKNEYGDGKNAYDDNGRDPYDSCYEYHSDSGFDGLVTMLWIVGSIIGFCLFICLIAVCYGCRKQKEANERQATAYFA